MSYRKPKTEEPEDRSFFGSLASNGVSVLKMLQQAGEATSNRVSRGVQDAISSLKSNPDPEADEIGIAVKNDLGAVMERGLKSLRYSHIIDPVDSDVLPTLLTDPREDKVFKRQITDELSTRLNAASPFQDALELIAKRAFDRGVHPDQLTAAFETEEILDFLVHRVITIQHSRFRGSNLAATISSVLDSVILKAESVASRVNKKEVHGETEEEILLCFADFKKHYDPHNARRTIAEFMSKLEKKFPDHDVLNWLLKNKKLFTKLLRGHNDSEEDEIDPKKCHVHNLIHAAYIKRAKEKGLQEQFIQLYIPQFLDQQPGAQPKTILHLDEIVAFFQNVAPTILTPEISKIHLRAMIINACLEKIHSLGSLKIIIADSRTNVGEEVEFNDIGELSTFVKDKIKTHAVVDKSYVEVVNLLADPDSIPRELEKDYNRFFDQEGKLKAVTYHRGLRKMFALVQDLDEDGSPEKEPMAKIKRRITAIFNEAQEYIDAIHSEDRGLGLPCPNDFPEVREAVDYAELVKIACRGETDELRFSARRKIEIGWLIYLCIHDPTFVFAEHEAKSIKLHLEDTEGTGGLRVDKTKPLTSIIFKYENDQIEIVASQDDENGAMLNEDGLHVLKLIPAEIADLECFLVPANHGNKDPHEYMDLKSLFSAITKYIRKRAKVGSITDHTRMTIAVETIEDLKTVLEYFQNYYLSFGQRMKVEIRGFSDDEMGLTDFGVEPNPYKGNDYRAVRLVVKVLIPDSSGTKVYHANFELRIILLKDLLLEKIEVDPGDSGHKNYVSRRQSGVMTVLEPESLAPALYKQVGPRPHDLWEDTSSVLKKKSD